MTFLLLLSHAENRLEEIAGESKKICQSGEKLRHLDTMDGM